MAKIEGLLGRAGVLDLAETDGVTGFYGARADEAVRKFQKHHGLQVDGLINPNGPTLQALASLARPVPRRDLVPPGTIEEFPRPATPVSEWPPVDPRQETVRRIVERLLAMRRQGDNPLSFGTLPTRLAQSAATKSDDPTTRNRDNVGDGKQPAVAPAPTGPEKGTEELSAAEADLKRRLREYLDELKQQATSHDDNGEENLSKEEISHESKVPGSTSNKTDAPDHQEPSPRDNKVAREPGSEEGRLNAIVNFLDTVLGLIWLRGVGKGVPNGPTILGVPDRREPDA